MKKRSLLGALLAASVAFAGCGGGGGGGDTRSSENTMNSFGFESLSEEGAITGTAVAVTVPYQTDVKALVASFQVSAKATVEVNGKAQVSGTTPNDFTSPVTYTVKAEDGTAREYIVTATAPAPMISFALQRKSDINVTVPALLQNGTFHLLDMGISNTLGWTRCNTVAGTDTYVAGSVGSSYGRQKPVYWKNRALKTLALPAGATGVARELSFVNGHLYVVGDVYDGVFANSNAMPGYWLDDVWHAFSKVVPSGAGTETAIAASAGGGLNVDGSDYYSCGWMDLPSHGGKRTPAYWKNGIPVTLPVDYSSYDGAFATNIAIVGSSVYVTGVLAKGKNWDPLPVYWKDGGDPVLIPAGTSGYGAEWGYIVVGNDRYGFGMVGTWAESIPAYWKNWQLTTLPLPSGADHGNANWIRPVSECGLAGKDVYIDGTVSDAQGRGILAYWLNGTPHTIPLPANLASNFAGAVGQQMLLMR